MWVRDYYRAVVDCWRFFRKYMSLFDSEENWKELVKETHRIYERYRKAVFVKNLLLDMTDEIERIWTKRQGEENKGR